MSAADRTAIARYVFQNNVGENEADLTSVIREYLTLGWTRITLRLSCTQPLEILRAGSQDTNSSYLQVTTKEQAGVIGDLYNSAGELLVKGQSVIDLRKYAADTYYLRVYNPNYQVSTGSVQNSKGVDYVTPSQMTAVGSDLYFLSGGKLYMTNSASTSEIKDASSNSITSITQLLAVDDTLYFTVDNGTVHQLWKTSGIYAVKVTGANMANSINNMTSMGGKLYFAYNDGISGSELWMSNGSSVTLVKDAISGSTGIQPTNMTVTSGILYFVSGNTGRLWKTDGTSANTTEVLVNDTGITSDPVIVAAGSLFSFVNTGGIEIWKTTGDLGYKVSTLANYANPQWLGAVNGAVYFTVTRTSDSKIQLWKSDGTSDGTICLTDLPTGTSRLHKVENDLLYFTVNTGTGLQLWQTNGSASGSKQVVALLPGNISLLTSINNTLYFIGENNNMPTLWRSTSSGMQLVASLPGTVNSISYIDNLVYLGIDENAAAEIMPPGDNNDIRIIGSTAVAGLNNNKVLIVDDPTITNGSAVATYAIGAVNTLTIRIQAGVTTARNIVAAINAEGTFNAILNTRLEAANDGSGTVNTAPVATSGGSLDTAASVIMDPPGINNGLIFAAINKGPESNGVTVKFLDDGSIHGDSATAYYDSSSRMVTVKIMNGVTRAASVKTAVESLSQFTGSQQLYQVRYLNTDNGTGVVYATDGLMAGGVLASPSIAVLSSPGADNDLHFTAKNEYRCKQWDSHKSCSFGLNYR